MDMNRLLNWACICAVTLVFLSSCTNGGTQPEASFAMPSPTSLTQEAPTIETPDEQVIETPSSVSPTVPDASLSEEGPWWVFSTKEGLWTVNHDGTGLTRLSSQRITPPFNRRILVAPQGGHIAYITGRDQLIDVTLRIKIFPWRSMVTEKPLTSDQSAPGPDSMPGDPEFEALRAVTEVQSMAFSPDGRYLAFMGMIEGPTSDLYLFSLDNYEITRLTDGPTQAIKPVWSPDGKYIVHAGVSSLGTGAGYGMLGFWASLADDSGAISLFDPSSSGDQQVIGWLDERTFMVYSWNAGCGPNLLRTFNIETKETWTLWEEAFSAIAFDPQHAVAVLSVTYESEFCNPNTKLGLYLVPADGSAPFRIVKDLSQRIIWSENANLFLASTEFGVLAIDSNGQFIDLDMPQGANPFPAVAPGTKELAWPGEALWIGPLLGSIDNPPREIFAEPVYNVTWDPSGQYVLFFADNGLYVAQRPDFIPHSIAKGYDNRNGYSGWVLP